MFTTITRMGGGVAQREHNQKERHFRDTSGRLQTQTKMTKSVFRRKENLSLARQTFLYPVFLYRNRNRTYPRAYRYVPLSVTQKKTETNKQFSQ